jgi:hypothetical protein
MQRAAGSERADSAARSRRDVSAMEPAGGRRSKRRRAARGSSAGWGPPSSKNNARLAGAIESVHSGCAG